MLLSWPVWVTCGGRSETRRAVLLACSLAFRHGELAANPTPRRRPLLLVQETKEEIVAKGLYANINAKKKRIAAGSGEKMRKPGSKGAPSAKDFKDSAKTAKKK